MKTTHIPKSAKPPSQPAEFDDPRFDRILAAVISGLASQFEQRDGDDCMNLNVQGEEEADRIEALARRAILLTTAIIRRLQGQDPLSVFSENV